MQIKTLTEKSYTVFEDSEGGKHFSVTEARDAQMEINLYAWAEENGLCKGGEWTQSMVIDLILDTQNTLREILNPDISYED